MTNTDISRRQIILSALVSILSLITGCSTLPHSAVDNPWKTPNRAFVPQSAKVEAELQQNFIPCIQHARATVKEAITQFKQGLPKDAVFYIQATNDKGRNYYIRVTSVSSEQITGRLLHDQLVKNHRYSPGDTLSISPADIFDWNIIYQDQPEAGNLLGKYMLLLQDGVVTGPCDPHSQALSQYRLFRDNYSFVPPPGLKWSISGKQGKEADAILQNVGSGPYERNTIFSARYQARPINTNQELIDLVKQKEKMEFESDTTGRYTLIKQQTVSYPDIDANCARYLRVENDQTALLSKSGERGPMTREIHALYCLHPTARKIILRLTFSHRYQAGHRNPDIIKSVDKLFQSLAFSRRYLPCGNNCN